MSTRAEAAGRIALAVGTAMALVLALMMVTGGTPARADHANTCEKVGFPSENKVESGAGTNVISNGWGSATWEGTNDNTLALNINEDWEVDICVKAGGSGGIDGEGVHIFTATDETENPTFPHAISHASWKDPAQTTTTTTTVPDDTTTTTEPEDTTTTTEPEDTTTTTVPEETTTTIEGEVLGTDVTTTTIEDEVLGTDVLPFTGVPSDALALAALALIASGALALGVARRATG